MAGKKERKGLVDTGEESPAYTNRVLFGDGREPGSEWRWLHEKVLATARTVNDQVFRFDISAGGDIQFARYSSG